MHLKKTPRVITLVLALAAILAATLTTPAQAAVYGMWHFRDGQICLADHGSIRWYSTTVVSKWNAADVNLVRDNTCSAYPRSQVIDVRTYDDPNDYACGKTGSANNDYSWVYVSRNGVRTAMWAPNKMTIWLNVTASLAPRCNATSSMRAHLMAHETGHAIGLGHPPAGSPTSVMPQGSWSVIYPTAWDLGNVNAYY